jgi:hypothetical protein
MNQIPPLVTDRSRTSRRSPLLPAIIAFVLGAVLAGIWFYRQNTAAHGTALSEQTRSSLANLASPVTIRFYSVLPAGSAGDELTAFSTRVGELLAAMQEAGNGKIQVTSIEGAADTSANAASDDRLQAFNMDKGDACYLGLAISSGANKQTMPRLQPEWESALQYDLARAILAVAAASAPPPVRPEIAKPSPEIISSIQRLIPDASSVTVEQADQIFHAEYLKQCGEVGAEAEANIQAAQQKVVQAQTGGAAADVEAARKNLLQVQLAQGEKLKDLAAQLQIQLAVFQRMKAGNTNPSK